MATFPSIQGFPSYPFIEIPKFNTNIIKYQNNVEQRIANFNTPQWSFKVRFPGISDSDKYVIQDFFIARKGAYESFTFINPDPPQIIGSDSENYTAKLSHIAAASNYPITGENWETYWTKVGSKGIAWVSGRYYIYSETVRFALDMYNFEGFSYRLWRLEEIELIQVPS